MKKITMIAAAVLACAMLAGCGGKTTSDNTSSSAVSSTKTPAERTQAVLDGVQLPEMVEVSSDRLMMYYKIDESTVSEFSAYICGSGAMPDEFGCFVFTDSDAAAAGKEAIEARVEKQRSTYADYTPDEMYKFDDYFVSQSGNTVSYAVCADNTAAKEALG
ncbi:MAG: DUF4358 domain-containing protein [Oscillospiraceae bacterium]